MKLLFFNIISIITAIFILQSCANIQPPSGGEKDETAPKLIKSNPRVNEKRFSGRRIELEFDEPIQERNLREQLIISPAITGDLEYSVRNKKLIIDLENELEPNTTYILNFRKGIADVTEANVPQDLNLAFSTGDYIDSIEIAGTIKDMLTGAAIDNAIVALFRSSDTLDITNGKPKYTTRTDKTGSYILRNLKNESYNLYVLADQNNNQLYDQPAKEKIGFIKNLHVQNDTLNVNIPITISDTRPIQLISKQSKSNFESVLEFNKGVTEIKVEDPNNNNQKILTNLAKNRKNLAVYNTWNLSDSITLRITAVDSLFRDTTFSTNIIFDQVKDSKKEISKPERLIQKYDPDDKLVPNVNPITISFTKPVQFTSDGSIKFRTDSIITIYNKENVTWKENQMGLTFNVTANQADTIQILIPDSTFISIDNIYTTAEKKTYTIKQDKDYSTLSGTVNLNYENYFFQLLNEKFEVLQTIKNLKNFSFRYLTPGTYIVRILVDEDNNGRWDNLNFEKRQKAEPVFIHKDRIQLRANWEVSNQKITF